MPQLSFPGQNNNKRPGGWIVPVVLIVLCVLTITLSVRVGNAGVFSAVRTGVHTVSAPLQSVCSVVSKPFKAIGGDGSKSASAYSDDEIEALIEENEQLKTLVAELEEYRQQDQRLTTLLTLSDTYGLETVSANVINVTDGWTRTATINVGSSSGVQVGMGVISSCGLYGQVESVTSNQAVVRLVTDATSSVSAMVQSTRETGIVTGAYDGSLTLDYISVDSTVGAGDAIITSGEGGTYPRGIVIGTVKTVDPDSSKLYYRITVEPIFNVESCEEVLVLTGKETETSSLLDTDLIKQITESLASLKVDLDAQSKEQEAAATAATTQTQDAVKEETATAEQTTQDSEVEQYE